MGGTAATLKTAEFQQGSQVPSHDGPWVEMRRVEETGEAETMYNLQCGLSCFRRRVTGVGGAAYGRIKYPRQGSDDMRNHPLRQGTVMDSSLWRALQITLPNGQMVVDVAGSGRFARQVVSVTIHGTSRVISSLPELCDSLKEAETSPKQLAMQDPVGFAYLLSVLSGRPHHVLPRDDMWPELEQHFGLRSSTSQPGIEDGIFQFVAYFQYMPVLKVSRIRVDLSTLELKEELLISSPWPPGPATTQVTD